MPTKKKPVNATNIITDLAKVVNSTGLQLREVQFQNYFLKKIIFDKDYCKGHFLSVISMVQLRGLN